MPITADYTTFEQFHSYESGSVAINIDNCTIQDTLTNYYNWTLEAGATINSFTNNTIAVTGNYGFQCNKTHTAFDNIVVTGSGTNTVIANGGILEFDNSNFDVTKVQLLSGGAILSKNHNDVANDCQMILPGAGNMDIYTDTLATQNVTVYKHASYTPVLTINTAGRTYGGLTIPAGSTVTHASTHTFTVTGNVDITGVYTGGTGAPTFGSLTIGASGTYSATSGITTINSHSSNWILNNSGTFTHNNGLVHSTQTAVNNAKIDMDGDLLYDLQLTTHPRSTKIESNTTIANDFTVTSGYFNTGSDRDLTVHGLTTITGTFTGNASTVTHNGPVIVNTGGSYVTSSGTNNFNSLRNLGGTVS